jgi:hypothetical protein
MSDDYTCSTSGMWKMLSDLLDGEKLPETLSKSIQQPNMTNSCDCPGHHGDMNMTKHSKYVVLAWALAGLAACGSEAPPTAFTGELYEKAATISGEVRIGSRVITQGQLDATDFNGRAVASAEWSAGNYQITIPAATTYPIMVTAHPQNEGTTILRRVIVKPETDKIMITERTTAIADKAAQMGGYTPDNVMAATLDTSGPINPIGGGPSGESTQHYGGWH